MMCVKFKTLNVAEITHKPTYTVTEDLTLLANVFVYLNIAEHLLQ
jgi:hypothetical protein